MRIVDDLPPPYDEFFLKRLIRISISVGLCSAIIAPILYTFSNQWAEQANYSIAAAYSAIFGILGLVFAPALTGFAISWYLLARRTMAAWVSHLPGNVPKWATMVNSRQTNRGLLVGVALMVPMAVTCGLVFLLS